MLFLERGVIGVFTQLTCVYLEIFWGAASQKFESLCYDALDD